MSDIDIEHLRSLGDQKVLCKASQLVQLIEAAAAKDAECERLRLSLGRATVDLMGMRDGALVRDQAVEIDSLRASVAAKDAEIALLRSQLAVLDGSAAKVIRAQTAEIATLRARLAAAEAMAESAREAREATNRHPLLVGFEHGEPTRKELAERLSEIRSILDAALAAYEATKETPHD